MILVLNLNNLIDQPSGAVGKSVNGELSAILDEDFQDPSSSVINRKYKMEQEVEFEGKKNQEEGNNDQNPQGSNKDEVSQLVSSFSNINNK